jgi:hypothetical protein
MLVITITYCVYIMPCYKLYKCFDIITHLQAHIRLQTTVVAMIDVALTVQKHIYETRMINK